MAADLEVLRMPEHFVVGLSGLQYSDDAGLLVPRGNRGVHALISSGVGAAASLAVTVALVSPSRYEAAALVALVISAVVCAAAGDEVIWLALCLGLAALVALFVVLVTLVMAKGGVAWIASGTMVLVGATSYALARGLRARRRRRGGYDVLGRVHASASRFNKLLSRLDVKDQLLAAQGASVDPVLRASVIGSLRVARENLVRTLKVERIIRENRALLDDVGGAEGSHRSSTAAQRFRSIAGGAAGFLRQERKPRYSEPGEECG